MDNLVIYVHGKGGTADEVKHYKPLFPESDVIGFDYKSQNPWDANSEFCRFYDWNSKGYDSVTLVANSIGAFFSMNALAEKMISKALFISPVVNMERLISDMMIWANITEDELFRKKEIPTDFGETIYEFAEQAGATLTVMNGGEHWFHTVKQMEFLDDWIRKSI